MSRKEMQKQSIFFQPQKQSSCLYVHCRRKKRNEEKIIITFVACLNQTEAKKSNMSEHDSYNSLFHTANSEIVLKPLPKGHIHVDWSNLPKHRNIRQYVIHYKSLNTNKVRKFFFFSLNKTLICNRVKCYVSHGKSKILF
jgi:hypothetical protein